MTQQIHPQMSLRAVDGRRKYLTPDERHRFIEAASFWSEPEVGLFCLMLAHSGCRISEALAMTGNNIDFQEKCVAIRSLKKRGRIVIRTVPLPDALIERFKYSLPCEDRLWPISRTKAWMQVKLVMKNAGIENGPHATAKGLRHGFGLHAVRCSVPLNILQRWLGHARISTTTIYADATGPEERAMAMRVWTELG